MKLKLCATKGVLGCLIAFRFAQSVPAQMSVSEMLAQVRIMQGTNQGVLLVEDGSNNPIKLVLSYRLATDRAIKAASSLDSLRELTVACGLMVRTNEPMTAEGIQNLQRLPKLEQLTINYVVRQYSPEMIQAVASLTNLHALQFANSSFEPGACRLLSPLINLERFSLKDARDFTDENLQELPPFPRLRELDLSNTEITDASLANLLKFPNLRRVDLFSTKVTEAGVKRAGLPPEMVVNANWKR